MATLQELQEKRRICRCKYTRQENTVNKFHDEVQEFINKGEGRRSIEMSMRKAATAMEELNRLYSELRKAQDEIDFHPDLDGLSEEAKKNEIESEERYRNSYFDVSAKVQQLQVEVDGMNNNRSPSEADSSKDGFSPEQFAEALKQTFEGINTGISGEQLEQILGSLNRKKRHIQIPKFKGDPELFDQWKKLVESELEKPGYSEVEKTQVVITLLDGEVSKLVAALKDPSSSDILEFLEQRYGDILAKVQRAVNEIASVSAVNAPSAKELDALYNSLISNWNYIMKRTSNDKSVIQASWIFTALVRPKLPKALLKKWDADTIKEEKEKDETSYLPVKFNELLEKLQDAVKVARRSDSSKKEQPKEEKKKDFKEKDSRHRPTGHALPVTKKSPGKPGDGEESCIFCNSHHFSASCPTARSMSVQERVNKVKEARACFNCLRTSHFVEACKSSHCKNCQRNHHTLLHYEKRGERATEKTSCNSIGTQPESTLSTEEEPEQVKSSSALVKAVDSRGEILMQTGVARLESKSAVTRGRVLFDTGSGATFISERMTRKLQLKGKRVTAEFSLAGGKSMTLDTERVKFHLSSLLPGWKGETFEIVAYVLDSPCADVNEVKEDLTKLEHLKGLQLADQFPRKREPVDVLLGIQDTMSILQEKRVMGMRNSPLAQKSHIGWIVSGPCPTTIGDSQARLPLNHATFHINNEIEIATKHWELEHLGILPNEKSNSLSELEREALKQHEAKTMRKGDRYETGLLRHPEYAERCLKSNKIQATRRLIGLERRLMKDPDLSVKYQEQVDELIQAGRAERVIETEEPDTHNVWYLPHHPVIREDKTTTKVRIVFDGSMKGPEGVSLNDTLLSGPALQPDLAGVLLRFRRNKIALIADVEKMFLQVSMDPTDRDSQRFLWRDLDETKEPEIYRLTTVTFGLSSSPFSSIKTVLDHVATERENYSKAVSAIEENIFVDDVYTGDESVEETAELAFGLKQVMKTGGFNLRKFLSNKPEVLAKLSPEDRAPQLTEKLVGEEIATKALGVRYLPEEDVFMFSFFEKMDDTQQETRRNMLKQLHRVYDPLGMLSPFTLRAKLIFQQSWISTGGWDEPLQPELEEEWRTWKGEVPILDSIKVQRCLIPEDFKSPVFSLHAFGDACESSYGGVVYLRAEEADSVHVTLLCSKTRVAPLGKRRSLPELELMASLVTARLLRYTEKELKLPIKSVTCWTDSKVVINWISKPAYSWQTFVANRVAEIQELVEPSNWKHVPGKWNPADLCSRGASAKTLVESELWWTGPSFLKREESEWPLQQDICKSTEDERSQIESKRKKQKLASVLHIVEPKEEETKQDEELVDYAKKFTSLNRFIGTMATVRSFLRRKRGEITLTDRKEEKLFWVRWAQQKAFPEEIAQLKENKPVSANSPLVHLSPQWDPESQVVRVGGRLHYSQLPEETRHPIILPRHNLFVEMLVMHFHKVNLHTGVAQTLASLRYQYWIIHGKQEVRRILHNCQKCKEPAKVGQQMAPLPEDRITPTPSFEKVGVDFAGPLYIKISESKTSDKAYICLFTCLVCRAIHLELVPDLTTEMFMMALRRMMNRRGRCRRIRSDNAKTFQKASKILYSLFKDERRLKDKVAELGIEWKFQTERAPWHGGYFERMVGSVKRVLRKVLGKSRLTYVELETVLTDVEAQVNSRPLTQVSSDVRDLSPLTPGHFLIGRNVTTLPDIDKVTKKTELGKRWTYQQRLSKIFWNRWTKEYLLELNMRKKWTEIRDNIQEDDVVLIVEDNTRKMDWSLGRVIAVHPGRDGLVRSVTLKTKKGTIRRPVQKLRLMEAANEYS